MIWVPFSAAVHEVQRQLGIPLLKANEALFAAIDNDEVTSRWDEDDLFVLDTSVLDWIKAQQRRKPGGKQPRIRKLLAQMFEGRVPDDCVRKALRADLLKADRSLGSLDYKTLNIAIKAHNSEVGNVGNTNASD
jgi:hypothetical protein